ncbi:SIMPL domain-containing protein [Paenibacillus sp. N4]|uniref:SIMPL domain-containing protein n=1 Tax=Paenibacillus vietnamensis TaxID=2590547 RepID=UPI001CD0BBD5|nr:SIMPL domain-containing protein [Paenibacillus vietnamensis]MCA0753777.1 SIMPL domain-containing protein [Paenibacillus vietnamensis]
MKTNFAGQAATGHSKCPFTIEVTGEGERSATPDEAVIVLGAISEGKELQELQAENAEAVSGIIQALLALGLPREQIQTAEFRIEPQYDFPEGQQVFRDFKITHLLQIRTDMVDSVGALIDTAVAHGANQVSSLQFTLSEPERYEDEALSLAIANARRKAETIAASLGVALAAIPCEVQELTQAPPPVPFALSLQKADAAGTPIQPGQLTVRASVRVWYWYQ